MVASLLRAASTAAVALVASSSPLSVNENGTYYTTVLLGSKSVKMGIDMNNFGIWVSCQVFEDDQCDVGVSGYPTDSYGYRAIEYNTLSYSQVTIAGQVLKDLDVYVAYDPLELSDPTFQGYVGLDSGSINDHLPPLGKGANVSTIALQLGTSSNDSVLSINSIDQTLLTAKQLTTKTVADSRVSCFRLPVARSNTTVEDCTFTPDSTTRNYQATFNLNSDILQLEYTTLKKFEDRFVDSCSKVYSDSGYSYSTYWYGYTCNATMKLPRLMVQLSAWEFYLDPVDYTAPANATKAGVPQVRVLIGGSSTSDSWVLGKPFLRKFPIMMNTTAEGYTSPNYNLFCTANTTCRNVPARAIGSDSGTTGGGGGGGGGTSSDLDIDVSAGRKKNKLYLSIGLGVGGVVLLALFGCLCKCCKNADEDGNEDEGNGGGDKAIVVEEATVELTIAMTTSSGESSDRGDKQEKKKKKSDETTVATVKAVKKGGEQKKPRSKRYDSSSDSSSDSAASSDYDSESSEERRRERRRRRRRRRDRRREQKEKQAVEAVKADVETEETGATETHYVKATTPRAAGGSS